MKSLKIYLIVVSVILVIAIAFGVYAWYVLQNLSVTEAPINPPPSSLQTKKAQTKEVQVEEAPQSESIVISKDQLSEGQQQALNTFHIEGEAFVITPQMISCAEDSLGTERFNEILGGAKPGPIESVKLLTCFKK